MSAEQSTQEPLYVIAWRSTITGKSGHGTARFTFKEAQEVIREIEKQSDKPIEYRPMLASEITEIA